MSPAEIVVRSHPPPRGALITGATGFLGAAVLHAILHSTALAECRLYCLVRPLPTPPEDREAATTQRLQDEMRKHGCWDGSLQSPFTNAGGRLHVLARNSAVDWLELAGGEEAFNTRGAALSLIIHIASVVNHATDARQ